jgi:hypothetical protein
VIGLNATRMLRMAKPEMAATKRSRMKGQLRGYT